MTKEERGGDCLVYIKGEGGKKSPLDRASIERGKKEKGGTRVLLLTSKT